MDYLTNWPEVFAVPDQTALTIARLMVEQVISRHRVPSQLLSDRGACFLSYLMQELCTVMRQRSILPHITLRQMGCLNGSTAL